MKRMLDRHLVKCAEWLKDHTDNQERQKRPEAITEAVEIIWELMQEVCALRALLTELPKEGDYVTIKAPLSYAEDVVDKSEVVDTDYDEFEAGSRLRLDGYPTVDLSYAVVSAPRLENVVYVDTLDLIRAMRGEVTDP